jgi:hypothetical protein
MNIPSGATTTAGSGLQLGNEPGAWHCKSPLHGVRAALYRIDRINELIARENSNKDLDEALRSGRVHGDRL